jgi:hypothetical protein
MRAHRLIFNLFPAVIFGLVLIGSTTAVTAARENDPGEANITFQWTFGAVKKAVAGPKFDLITGDTSLNSGDQIKFFVKLETQSFVYLIYHSSQGQLSVLFPYRFKPLGSESHAPGQYYIPQNDQWFELDDHTGQETFYLLASANRLHDLETLVNDYESADRNKQPVLCDEIIAEIRRLRKQNLQFKAYAEKPVTIIGNLRGSQETKATGVHNLADHAVEIKANNFFSRTFTIDHR